MIKVEHIKTHIVDRPNGTASGKHTLHESVLVAPAKLVLVESQYYAKFSIKPDRTFHLNPLVGIGYKPIFISETEKIEVGDWVYDFIHQLYQAKTNIPLNDGVFKIVVLPEHFSPEHLQMIVDGKLKDGGKYLIECERLTIDEHTALINWELVKKNVSKEIQNIKNRFKVKLNPHITIYPVEEQ